ncbi:MAG: penicillin acylase family protein, partial [Bacteroidota bacterium]
SIYTPHIFANSLEDALFAQGYLHAQHRLWQMDISVRAAAGRLSEIMGKRTLAMDQLQRKRGIGFAAERAVESWQNSQYSAALRAYVDGVNAYIKHLKPKDYPIEFKLLDYAPEEWTMLHTALFVRQMAFRLNFRHNDIAATNTLHLLGPTVFEELFPSWNPKQSPIIPTEGTEVDSATAILPIIDTTALGAATMLPYQQANMPPEGIGSNNWAVAGSKTRSGNPILCNDPHLGLTLPSIWYALQMQTPTLNTYGVSLPGMPGVIIGFNEHIAWGQTNVGHDLADWYKITWKDERKEAYLLDGAAQAVTYRVENIGVRDAATVVDSVKYTHWGPIVYEDADSDHQDLALRWMTHDAPHEDELYCFIALNQATNYEEFKAALQHYSVPAQNFVFASKTGDIAMYVKGKLPIKQTGQGRFVQEGHQRSRAWSGIIPMEELPQSKNPVRAFVASANQHTTAPNYPYYYNSASFDDYRGRFINRQLSAMQDITPQDMMALQTSNQSLFAEEGLPLLLRDLDKSSLDKAQLTLVKVLEDWKYSFD